MTSIRLARTCALLTITSLVAAGCASNDSASPTKTVVRTVTAGASATTASASSSADSPSTSSKCPVIALDPGHNGSTIAEFDPKTGVAMRDYPNGAEDADVLAVAKKAKTSLERAGYRVVLLKTSTSESVSYRERVRRAEQAGATVGISIHTYTDDHRVFPQRVGLYREGTTSNGTVKRVTFTNAGTASKSQRMSQAFATARSTVEGRPVQVGDNSFDGRAPLWGGNIPVISLLSDKVPWVYNEFGINGGGGSNPLGAAGVDMYAKSIVAGTKAAVPTTCRR